MGPALYTSDLLLGKVWPQALTGMTIGGVACGFVIEFEALKPGQKTMAEEVTGPEGKHGHCYTTYMLPNCLLITYVDTRRLVLLSPLSSSQCRDS